MSIDAREFLDLVRQPLEAGDAVALADQVLARWQAKDICTLLDSEHLDVRRVASVTLGLIGDRSCIGPLSQALHDEDEQVNHMAEHGLWAIWFRDGKAEAMQPFRDGVALIGSEAYDDAVTQFEIAVDIDPDFAEAYNQRSIARFFLGQWKQALADCQETARRMPVHFGAISGMGHCYAHLCQLHDALKAYRRAVAINPRMTAICNAIERLDAKLVSEKSPSSGAPEEQGDQPVDSVAKKRKKP